jgi:hypothetical protein
MRFLWQIQQNPKTMNAKHLRYLSLLVVTAIPVMAAAVALRAVQLAQAAETPTDGESDDSSYAVAYPAGPSYPVGPAQPACPTPALPGGEAPQFVPPAGIVRPFAIQTLDTLVERYNRLWDEGRFEDLRAVAQWAEEIAPEAPVVQKMLRQEKLVRPAAPLVRPAAPLVRPAAPLVQPAAPLGGNQEMAQLIAKRLRDEVDGGKLSNYDIKIQFEDGVCKLQGRVTSLEQKAIAEKLVRGIPGIDAVSLELTIGERETPAPAPAAPAPAVPPAAPAPPAKPSRPSAATSRPPLLFLPQY